MLLIRLVIDQDAPLPPPAVEGERAAGAVGVAVAGGPGAVRAHAVGRGARRAARAAYARHVQATAHTGILCVTIDGLWYP